MARAKNPGQGIRQHPSLSLLGLLTAVEPRIIVCSEWPFEIEGGRGSRRAGWACALGEASRFRFVEDHFDRDTWVPSLSFSE